MVYGIQQQKKKRKGADTHDIFGIRRQGDIGPLRMLVPQYPGDDVRVGDRGHGGEAVVLGFPQVDLVAILLDGVFGALELGAGDGIR